jgi:hypothetical protein
MIGRLVMSHFVPSWQTSFQMMAVFAQGEIITGVPLVASAKISNKSS